jgi:uncharacterized RDD family membrane protein YckC
LNNPTDVVGRRIGGYIIDLLIVAAISALGWFLLTKKFGGSCIAGGVEINGSCRGFESGSSNRTIWFLVQLVAWFTIFGILPGVTGKSPGQALFGVRTVSRQGGRGGAGRGLLRALVLGVIDTFPYIFPLVGLISVLTDSDQHKSVADRVSGTLVVNKNAEGQPVVPGGGQQYGQYGGPAFSQPPPGYGQQAPPPPPQPPVPVGGGQPAGWYDDPQRQARLRWWDGTNWTSHTSN